MAVKIEKEAKFYIKELKKVETNLMSLGAVCNQPRVFETNLRFDTPDNSLAASFKVLRLRQDTKARLTYKGPADQTSTVSARPEFEVVLSDLKSGQRILEALGYQIVTIYEKYRTAYMIDQVEVSLDEMPFGDFVEIEGSSENSIQVIANKLGLTWENRSGQSYMRLFATVKSNLNLSLRDLTFSNFENMKISPDQLQLQFADKQD